MSQEQNAQWELTLHDLMMVINIIDLAKRREKFDESEIEQIDPVFNRIVAFIEAKTEEVKAQHEQADSEEDATAES